MKHLNPSITAKIVAIECDDSIHSMTTHRGHQQGIVGLLSRDFVLDDKPLPLSMNIRYLKQHRKCPPDSSQVSRSTGRRQSQPVQPNGLVATIHNSTMFCAARTSSFLR